MRFISQDKCKEEEHMERLDLPEFVVRVIDRLEACGYEAYAVGGCVRDMIMGRVPNDYDVTTNALPEETKRCFDGWRVIETGIKHGTVTVISEGNNIEVTTYRLDGEYADNRHPKEVTFTSDITADLSRRDFTVNAMAYSHKRGFADAFDGMGDILNRQIRSVGDARQRFREDGLRILRALRFSSVLGFSIDSETAIAIHDCKELLKNISVERILSEFTKLITGSGAESILSDYRDVIAVFIPDVEKVSAETYSEAVKIVSLCPAEKSIRYAAFLGHLGGADGLIGRTLDRLNSDTRTRRTAEAIYECYLKGAEEGKIFARYAICRSGYEVARAAAELCAATGKVRGDAAYVAVSERYAENIERENSADGRCLSLSELKISGKQLMSIGIKGPDIGKILSALLCLVMEEKLENKECDLMSAAQRLRSEE